MRIEQYTAYNPKRPTAGFGGTLVTYDILTNGHDGNGDPDTSGFRPGCFDEFLQAGKFNIPVMMNHEPDQVVGWITEIVSYNNVLRVFGRIFDVRVFDEHELNLSIGARCFDIEGGFVTRAGIIEVSIVKEGADRTAKVTSSAPGIFKLN